VLLFSVAEKLSSEAKMHLMLFEGLMNNEKRLKREMAADTCRALYDGSDLRKDKFVESGGVTTFVHMMNVDGDDPNFMHSALLRLLRTYTSKQHVGRPGQLLPQPYPQTELCRRNSCHWRTRPKPSTCSFV